LALGRKGLCDLITLVHPELLRYGVVERHTLHQHPRVNLANPLLGAFAMVFGNAWPNPDLPFKMKEEGP